MNSPVFLPEDAASKKVESWKNATVIIEERLFFRECLLNCLLRCMESAGFQNAVLAFASVTDLFTSGPGATPDLLFLLSVRYPQWERIVTDIALLEERSPNCRIVLLSDVENSGCIRDALKNGVHGYVPTSMPFEVVLGVLQLVRAGGVFVPASSILSDGSSVEEQTIFLPNYGEAKLTARQRAVVDALIMGKPNKVIARELSMSECTVKVYVRNIMKKLHVRNRTEVAYCMNNASWTGPANSMSGMPP
jgi:DNA-binding NarL/FixJ family response regulator